MRISNCATRGRCCPVFEYVLMAITFCLVKLLESKSVDPCKCSAWNQNGYSEHTVTSLFLALVSLK